MPDKIVGVRSPDIRRWRIVGATLPWGTKSMKHGFVYIIQRVEKDEFYVGSAADVANRLKQHNAGNVVATKYKRPYKLVFQQQFDSLDAAKRIERRIKSWRRRDWIERTISDGEIKVS